SFIQLIPPPPRSTLFPYTTLFRSYELRRTRHQRRSRRSNHRHTRSRPCDVRLALGTNPNLPARGWRERAGLAGSLRVAHMITARSEEHTSELQSRFDLVCRLLLEK